MSKKTELLSKDSWSFQWYLDSTWWIWHVPIESPNYWLQMTFLGMDVSSNTTHGSWTDPEAQWSLRLTALTRIITFQEYEKKIEENDTKVLRPQALMIRWWSSWEGYVRRKCWGYPLRITARFAVRDDSMDAHGSMEAHMLVWVILILWYWFTN